METKAKPDDTQPGSLYMTLNPFYQPMFIADDTARYGFGEFIRDNVTFYCTDRKYLPDYWLFRCDLPDKNLIPPMERSDMDGYPEKIAGIMRKRGLGPADAVRLRDAAFCIEHGIDPLSEAGRHRALLDNPDYTAHADRYGTGIHVIRSGEAIFPT